MTEEWESLEYAQRKGLELAARVHDLEHRAEQAETELAECREQKQAAHAELERYRTGIFKQLYEQAEAELECLRAGIRRLWDDGEISDEYAYRLLEPPE